MSEQPSLVGLSVRDIDDSENPDFVSSKKPDFNQLNSSVRKINLKNASPEGDNYTSVAELNKEGALLTDDHDLDLDDMIAKGLDDISELKSSLEFKKKSKKKTKQHARVLDADVSNPISPVNSGTVDSLVTSTDPIDDTIIGSTGSSDLTNDDISGEHHGGNESGSAIRNSYGEIIQENSGRPHLARGDSYQQSVEELQSTASINGVATPRSGRSTDKRISTDYLRSLSRSLQRDHGDTKHHPSNESDMIYSTTSYSISQRDLENAPHVIQESLEEEATARHPAAPHRR